MRCDMTASAMAIAIGIPVESCFLFLVRRLIGEALSIYSFPLSIS